MKTIFLSMLTIAALASCTRQDFIDPPGPTPLEGEEMVVNITLSTGEKTKAAGVPTGTDEKTLNDITVFFLNDAGQIITKEYVAGTRLGDAAGEGVDPNAKKVTLTTRTTAQKIMVIANIGEERVSTGKPLSVGTKAQLMKVVQDLAVSDGAQQPTMIPFNKKNKVLMSGEGTVVDMTSGADGTATATATVGLNYIPAKITLAKISAGDNLKGEIVTNFKFVRAFLLKAQTKSYYFPDAVNSKYVADAPAFANGVIDSWAETPSGLPIIPDFEYQFSSVSDFGTAKPLENLAHWYVFENFPVDNKPTSNPTILAVEVSWMEVAPGTVDEEGHDIPEKWTTKMFNVAFAPGDKGVIEAGKAYNVELTFNGNFLPAGSGGNGGGGDEDPETPNTNANVTVTVTPANWDGQTIPKPFE